jgi:thiol-disulfide isomerase/thioredoxin
MRTRRFALLVLVASLALAQPAFRVGADPEKSKNLTSLKQALATLELQDLDGEAIQLSSYLGKGPVLFDFWAIWCKPCLKALPALDELHAELGPRGLHVIGINEDGPRNAPKVKPFMQTNGYTFPVLLDLNREAQRRMQVAALPTTLLLDADGTVLHSSFGYRPGEFEKLRPLIESLLPETEETDE